MIIDTKMIELAAWVTFLGYLHPFLVVFNTSSVITGIRQQSNKYSIFRI